MRVLSYGVDTVRGRWVLDAPAPVDDPGFRAEMVAAGWVHRGTTRLDGDEVVETQTYQYQDPSNSTVRYLLHGAGHVYSEFSVPRLLSGNLLNLDLAAGEVVRDQLDAHGERIAAVLGRAELEKLPRVDVAVDVAAGEARGGVISAMQQIVPGSGRKVTRHIYPGQTSMVRTAQLAVRGYDKAAELLAKIPVKDRPDYAMVVAEARQMGRTRIEFEVKPRSGLPVGVTEVIPTMIADLVDKGFPNKRVLVGGLERIRAEVDALDVSPQTRNALLGFAVRYAQLGEDGMKAMYSRRSWFRHKRRFLEFGLRLDDVTTWSGHIDFAPIVEELRLAA